VLKFFNLFILFFIIRPLYKASVDDLQLWESGALILPTVLMSPSFRQAKMK
jgi:hypothetical protein